MMESGEEREEKREEERGSWKRNWKVDTSIYGERNDPLCITEKRQGQHSKMRYIGKGRIERRRERERDG